MSESTATLVVTAVPNADADAMDSVRKYLDGVMPLFMKAGGQPVRRLKVSETINGNPSGMVLVMDFDSVAAVRNLFASSDYQALLPVRDRGFKEMNILICDPM